MHFNSIIDTRAGRYGEQGVNETCNGSLGGARVESKTSKFYLAIRRIKAYIS